MTIQELVSVNSAPPAPAPSAKTFVMGLLPIVVAALSGALMFTGLAREWVGLLGLVMMFALMCLRLNLGMAMAIPGLLGLWALVGWTAVEGSLHRIPFETTTSWTLTVLPTFVLMGLLLWRSGLTERLYDAARAWLAWLPGGLAVGTNVAGAGFSAMSGNTLGSLYPLARAGMPEMIKAGYDRRFAAASILSSGTLAHLIPPSTFLVIYAGVASVPVGPQIMAGMIPGLILTLIYVLGCVGVAVIKPDFAGGDRRGVEDRPGWGDRWRSLGRIWTAPVLIALTMGAMFAGVLTATEAGAFGAFGAFVIAALLQRRNKPFKILGETLAATVATTGSVFVLLIGAHLLSLLLTVSGVAGRMVTEVIALDLSRVQFLLLLVALYLVLGMCMDALAMMLLTVPLLLPLFTALDISPIWFGVFIVMFMELAVITPPVGVLAYVMYGIVQDPDVNAGVRISLGDVFKAAMVVVPLALVLVALMIAFPEIVTWLPDQM